ncbi:hypothetical protein COLO4_37690 [Corchorus olitorius]|uniref:Uncharacterized protein n=1 Tax=Corchorus olitorius TaxID=93759 RepID=A0A1R3FZZ2_9ROSI|nr:hypothetical protein COLO4_37690 [Corchorus olitorius]
MKIEENTPTSLKPKHPKQNTSIPANPPSTHPRNPVAAHL